MRGRGWRNERHARAGWKSPNTVSFSTTRTSNWASHGICGTYGRWLHPFTTTLSFPPSCPRAPKHLPLNPDSMSSLLGLVIWHAVHSRQCQCRRALATQRPHNIIQSISSYQRPRPSAPSRWPSNTRIIRKISAIENSLATLMKSVKEGLTLQREVLLPTLHHPSVSGPQVGY
jgi:hypothetical protein